MTDRLHSLTVVLAADTREDDAEALIAAIGQFRGVIKVSGNVSDLNSHVANQRAVLHLRQQIYDIFKKEDSR